MGEQPSIYERLQFTKGELTSLEEEKRFLIANLIVTIPTFFYLFLLFTGLLDQIILDIDRYKKIIFAFSMTITSLYFFRILYVIYVNYYEEQISETMNIFKNFYSVIASFTIVMNFMIILIYRIVSSYISISIPLDILDSWAYRFLLLYWGVLTILFIIVIAKTGGSFEKFNGYIKGLDIIKKLQKEPKEKRETTYRKSVYISLAIVATTEFISIISIIWLLSSLYYLYLPTYELIKTSIELGLVIICFLFIYEIWFVPTFRRLNDIRKKIKKLHQLRIATLRSEVMLDNNIQQLLQYYEEK